MLPHFVPAERYALWATWDARSGSKKAAAHAGPPGSSLPAPESDMTVADPSIGAAPTDLEPPDSGKPAMVSARRQPESSEDEDGDDGHAAWRQWMQAMGGTQAAPIPPAVDPGHATAPLTPKLKLKLKPGMAAAEVGPFTRFQSRMPAPAI